MKFSVITLGLGCHLNRLKRLEQSLEAQTTGEIEWLLIDDHVRPSLFNFRISIKTILVNHQLSVKRQLLQKATGDYFVFLGENEQLLPTAFQRLTSVLNFCHNNQNLIYDLNLNTNSSQDDQGQYFNYSTLKMHSRSLYYHWLKNRFWLYQYENEYDNLKSRLRLEGKILPTELMTINFPFFDVGLNRNANLSFMLQNLERADGIVQLSQFNGVGLQSCCLNLDQWFEWIRACFNSLLGLSDQTLIDAFIHYFIVNIDRYFYSEFISNRNWRPSQKIKILVEIQKILQLINPNSFNTFDDHQHRLPVLNRKILLAITRGNFSEAEKLMLPLIRLRKYQRLIDGKLAKWSRHSN